MTSGIKPIKIASFHDVHLGHRNTPTPDILRGFDPIFKNNDAELSTWDMLVFPGDLFDRLLFLTDSHLEDILLFLSRIIKIARKHDIVVRILEGTPGHDHKQSRLSTIVKLIMESDVDIKFIPELSVEYIEKLDIHVLYVPDEWNTDVADTYRQAQDLIFSRGLKKVDYCLFHGAFGYQIDETLNPKAHNEDLWSELVEYYIFAGHVHVKSQYKNILVAGSFDRLVHGEEGSKGWITCEVKKTGEHEIIFHENPYATLYVTLDVRNKDVEQILTYIEQTVRDYPERSHIRLHALDRDVVTDGIKELRKRFSGLYFTSKIDKKEKERVQRSLKLVTEVSKAIDLNPDNLSRVITERINSLPIENRENVLKVLARYL